MRIGGLATGMDIDELVEKLMSAERIPLDRMQQDKTELTWKRDAFRDMNKSLLELDNMMLSMKKSSTYNSKSVTSSNESAVTGTASSSTGNGTYKFEVTQLASSAMHVSKEKLDLDPTEKMGHSMVGEHTFKTYDENGDEKEHTFTINEDDSLNDVLKRISKDDNDVRAFYDENMGKVIMETTRTGKYSENGPEIEFADNAFFSDFLQMEETVEAKDAKFNYNGIENMTSKSNSYNLDGMQVQFQDEGTATLQVNNDTQATVESIMTFADKYNDVVETLNATQLEEKHRDFLPLTEEQKEEMSETEIELWEEKAKSGILRGESTISSGLFNMRGSWYSNVDTDGEYNSLTQIGITTSKKYLDGGKLEVDVAKLTEAIEENPDDVQSLFMNSDEGDSRGLVNRLEDAVESSMKEIKTRAGGENNTLETYTIGREMKDLNTRISDFEDRLERTETRYWNQFTEMEKAIQRMNAQSEQLLSQFGEGMM